MKKDLTKRQKNILELIAQGYTNDEIGEILYISRSTVNTHIRDIYQFYGLPAQPGRMENRLKVSLLFWRENLEDFIKLNPLNEVRAQNERLPIMH